MKRRKSLQYSALVFTLIIPVAIFLFLRLFGNNVYTIPVYYQQGIPEDSVGCENIDIPHIIPPFELEDANHNRISESLLDSEISIVDFYATRDHEMNKNKEFQLERINDRFEKDSGIQLIRICYDSNILDAELYPKKQEGLNNLKIIHVYGPIKKVRELAHCGFILLNIANITNSNPIQNDTFVLIDKQRRIRGYYKGTDFEDIDRMMIELDILLSEEG